MAEILAWSDISNRDHCALLDHAKIVPTVTLAMEENNCAGLYGPLTRAIPYGSVALAVFTNRFRRAACHYHFHTGVSQATPAALRSVQVIGHRTLTAIVSVWNRLLCVPVEPGSATGAESMWRVPAVAASTSGFGENAETSAA